MRASVFALLACCVCTAIVAAQYEDASDDKFVRRTFQQRSHVNLKATNETRRRRKKPRRARQRVFTTTLAPTDDSSDSDDNVTNEEQYRERVRSFASAIKDTDTFLRFLKLEESRHIRNYIRGRDFNFNNRSVSSRFVQKSKRPVAGNSFEIVPISYEDDRTTTPSLTSVHEREDYGTRFHNEVTKPSIRLTPPDFSESSNQSETTTYVPRHNAKTSTSMPRYSTEITHTPRYNTETTRSPRYNDITQSQRYNTETSHSPRYTETTHSPRYNTETSYSPRYTETTHSPQYNTETSHSPRYTEATHSPRYKTETSQSPRYNTEIIQSPRYTETTHSRQHNTETSHSPRYTETSHSPRYTETSHSPRYNTESTPQSPPQHNTETIHSHNYNTETTQSPRYNTETTHSPRYNTETTHLPRYNTETTHLPRYNAETTHLPRLNKETNTETESDLNFVEDYYDEIIKVPNRGLLPPVKDDYESPTRSSERVSDSYNVTQVVGRRAPKKNHRKPKSRQPEQFLKSPEDDFDELRLTAAESTYYKKRKLTTLPMIDTYDSQQVIPGVAGRDYSVFSAPPKSPFSCTRGTKGYFADVAAGCQVFYICTGDGRGEPMLCPNGTLFNQDVLVCDWWYNVLCDDQ